MKKTNILILILIIAVLTACTPSKGVTINEKGVKIAEKKCSISLDKFSEVTFEEVSRMINFSDAEKEAFANDEDLTFWEVNFAHQGGEHSFSDLEFDKDTGKMVISSLIQYNISNWEQARVLGGNLGLSSAYLAIDKNKTLSECTFSHKGYSFVYNFETNEWSYSED